MNANWDILLSVNFLSENFPVVPGSRPEKKWVEALTGIFSNQETIRFIIWQKQYTVLFLGIWQKQLFVGILGILRNQEHFLSA